LIGYTLLIAYWMLLGFHRGVHAEYRYNLQPLRTIRHFWHIQNAFPIETVQNLVLKLRFWGTMGSSLGGLLLLETAQLLTRRGIFDVDDILLNMIGVLLGYLLYLSLGRKRQD
jgi:glycopeptide antibiotics resistance protein